MKRKNNNKNSGRNNPNYLNSGSSVINNTLKRLENENLEFAQDEEFTKDEKDINDIGNRPIKKQTNVNDTSKNIISNSKK